MSYARQLATIARSGIATVDTVADLRALNLEVYPKQIQTLGCLTRGDGGDGLWQWDETSIATDNAVTVVAVNTRPIGRWLRVMERPLTPAAFGCVYETFDAATCAANSALLQAYINDKDNKPRSIYMDGMIGITRLELLYDFEIIGQGHHTGFSLPEGFEYVDNAGNVNVGSDNTYGLLCVDESENITVKNIKIDGKGRTTVDATRKFLHVMEGRYGEQNKFKVGGSCMVIQGENPPSSGKLRTIYVDGCWFHDGPRGCFIANQDVEEILQVSNCIFSDAQIDHWIYSAKCSGHTFTNCVFEGFAHSGGLILGNTKSNGFVFRNLTVNPNGDTTINCETGCLIYFRATTTSNLSLDDIAIHGNTDVLCGNSALVEECPPALVWVQSDAGLSITNITLVEDETTPSQEIFALVANTVLTQTSVSQVDVSTVFAQNAGSEFALLRAGRNGAGATRTMSATFRDIYLNYSRNAVLATSNKGLIEINDDTRVDRLVLSGLTSVKQGGGVAGRTYFFTVGANATLNSVLLENIYSQNTRKTYQPWDIDSTATVIHPIKVTNVQGNTAAPSQLNHWVRFDQCEFNDGLNVYENHKTRVFNLPSSGPFEIDRNQLKTKDAHLYELTAFNMTNATSRRSFVKTFAYVTRYGGNQVILKNVVEELPTNPNNFPKNAEFTAKVDSNNSVIEFNPNDVTGVWTINVVFHRGEGV